MDQLRTLAVLLPLGLSSGINLYATVLVAGLSIRFGWVQNPPSGLVVLSAWPVIILAGILYLLEFFADKIPFVDNLWDVVHTIIRPIGAALLGWATLSHADPIVSVLGALAVGGVALVSHGSKAGTRIAVNVMSPVENITNTGLSLAEDVIAGGLTYLALKYPFIAGGIAVALLMALGIIVPQVLRWAWFTIRALIGWAVGLRGQQTVSDLLSMSQAALLAGRMPEIAVACKVQNVKDAGGRSGILAVAGGQLYFLYDTRRGSRAWSIGLPQVRQVRLLRRMLIDVITVDYVDSQGRDKTARFVFLKDRALLAQKLALRLAAQGAGAIAQHTAPAGTP